MDLCLPKRPPNAGDVSRHERPAVAAVAADRFGGADQAAVGHAGEPTKHRLLGYGERLRDLAGTARAVGQQPDDLAFGVGEAEEQAGEGGADGVPGAWLGARSGTRYAHRMIRSFVHRGLRRAHERGDFSRLNPAHAQRIATILSDLHSARAAADLALPRYRLHPLKGDHAGAWSVRVSRTWRIEDGDVYDVDLVDYH